MKTPIPPCPVCKSNKMVVPQGTVGDLFFCNRNGCGLFDIDPDEGGDYHSDPSKRLERKESFRGRRA